jgi:hypothetical protein
LERHFFDDYDEAYEADKTEVDVPVKLSKPMETKDRNKFAGMVPPSSKVESPAGPSKPGRVSVSNAPIPKASRPSSRINDLRTPATSRFVSDGKENETPGTGSSRKAKDVAAARLHDYAPDIALYEKEKKRVGGVIYGGPRLKEDKPVKVQGRKRSLEEGNMISGTEGRDPKRVKKPKPSPVMHVMISGYKRWIVGSGHNDSEDRVSLQYLTISR